MWKLEDDRGASRGRTPIWQAISNTLRSEISDGRYRPGKKLPTEATLAARFEVNRHTVRHALSALAKEGIVRGRRGSGTFVSATPTDYVLGKRVRFHENLRAVGRVPAKRFLQIENRAASEGESAALGLGPGDSVCALHGLSLASGQPIALFESVFPLGRLPGIDAALQDTSSVSEALARAGVPDFTRASTRLSAIRADATQALHLQIQEGDPILRSTSVNIDKSGMQVEYGRTFFAGDRVTLTLEG